MERHDGRQGDTILVNGKETPAIRMAAGHQERWRVVNAASARYFLLHLGGKPFRQIGTDGGLLKQARTLEQVLITPGNG
jgi:FtsP/CotA-like multicopper oxidase with cupredoxin domain